MDLQSHHEVSHPEVMGNVTHSYHRLVQWTLAYLATMVAHYGHIGIGRFVDFGKRRGDTSGL